MESPYSKEWQAACQEEIDSQRKHGSYRMEDLPPGVSALHAVWVFDLKINYAVKAVRFKARLAAQGSRREVGVDHTREEVFAATVSLPTFRLFISVFFHFPDVRFSHFDVKTAFLNADLTKTVYLRQPQGFHDGTHRVWRLLKALYGLPEAMALWNDYLRKVLKKFHLQPLAVEKMIYYGHRGPNLIAVGTQVDDLYVACNNPKLAQSLLTYLNKFFTVNDLGPLKFTLGIELEFDYAQGTVAMNQNGYKRRVLEFAKVTGCTTKPTPLPIGYQIEVPAKDSVPSADELESMRNYPKYRSVLQKLNYVARGTMPQLSYSTSLLGRAQQDPRLTHHKAQIHQLQYVASTLDEKLIFRRCTKKRFAELVAFGDASYRPVNQTSFRSQSGRLIYHCGNLVLWESKRQISPPYSTLDSESRAMIPLVQHICFFRPLLTQLKVGETGPSLIWCDNKGVVCNSYNPVKRGSTKHIEGRIAIVRAAIVDGLLVAEDLGTDDMLADLLTKLKGPKDFVSLTQRVTGVTQVPTTLGYAPGTELVDQPPITWAAHISQHRTTDTLEDRWLNVADAWTKMIDAIATVQMD
jgi:hypothetical protein